MEAMALVILVVFLFLQSWRATLIPAVAVPVSLIGTFAGLAALDFSINTLTLFGMVLAIGIVVDDAIIVVENVERHMTQGGLSRRDAVKQAMTEVTGPVVASVLVLSAVFVPVGFLGGITGELYKQFAVTIALSVIISGLVALTLSPALCATVLKSGHQARKGGWRLFNRSFDWTQNFYVGTVGHILPRSVMFLGMFAVLVFCTWGLFANIPGSFLPDEDQGYFITIIHLPDGASKERTLKVVEKVERYFQSIPEVHSTDTLVGQNFVFNTRGTNQATMFIPLHDWDKRREARQRAQSLIGAAFQKFAEIPEALILAFNPPAIRGLGATGGFSLQLQESPVGAICQSLRVAQEFVTQAMQHPRHPPSRHQLSSQCSSTLTPTWIVPMPRLSGSRFPTCSIPCRPTLETCTSMISSNSVACIESRRKPPLNTVRRRKISVRSTFARRMGMDRQAA